MKSANPILPADVTSDVLSDLRSISNKKKGLSIGVELRSSIGDRMPIPP
jgi:hypothetical protein